jgi:DNA-binding NtrC family response regulator
LEDELRLRELLLDVLPDMGFPAPVAARSAEEARRIMTAEPREILVLDLQLPLMNGLEFLEVVRESWPRTQVIIMTGFGDLESARRAIRLDVVDFLSKPCHLRELEVSLDRARRRWEQTIDVSLQEVETDVSSSDVTAELPPAGEGDAITLAESERRMIMAALRRHNGNRTAAAVELGISRRTLHYRLNEYGQQSGDRSD